MLNECVCVCRAVSSMGSERTVSVRILLFRDLIEGTGDAVLVVVGRRMFCIAQVQREMLLLLVFLIVGVEELFALCRIHRRVSGGAPVAR